MIWPANLVTVALFRTLHESSDDGDDDSLDFDFEGHHQQQDQPQHASPPEEKKESKQGHEMRSSGSSGGGRGQDLGRVVVGQRMRRRMSRMRFFAWVTLGSFVWYWFPNYIFPTLTAFSILCWINPNNVVLSQLTGKGSVV